MTPPSFLIESVAGANDSELVQRCAEGIPQPRFVQATGPTNDLEPDIRGLLRSQDKLDAERLLLETLEPLR
jgi:hypothetical protein